MNERRLKVTSAQLTDISMTNCLDENIVIMIIQ